MKRWQLTLLLLAGIVGSACFFLQQRSNPLRLAFAGLPLKTSRTLKHADQFILFSLEPYRDRHSKLTDKYGHALEKFHSYEILGKTEITDKDERKKLLEELFDCVPTFLPPSFLMCFNPRQGIRVIRNGETVDILVCFECQAIRIYDPENFFLSLDPGNHPEFNRALKAAGVKLSDH